MATQVSLNSGAVASAGALALQTNGTTQAVSISTGQVATLAQNPVLTSGTINGVAYLNGTNVLTTGSALTFDGTNFSTTGSAIVSGSVRVGTNPASGGDIRLPTSGIIAMRNAANSANRVVLQTDASDNVLLQEGSVYITSAGNVGIGTSSPAKRLDVRQAYTADTVVAQIGNTNNGNGSTPVATIFDFTEANGTAVSRISSIYTQSTGKTDLAFGTYNSGLSEKMRLDSSGNLGLGVTPSAWTSVFKAAQVKQGSISTDSSNNTTFANNCYFDGSNWKYINTAASQQYLQYAGQHIWNTAPSGTGGVTPDTVSFTQAMTLDASGNLLVGTTSAVGKLTVVASPTATARSVSYSATGGTIDYYIVNGSNTGSISTNTTTTSYVTSSDYRLKNSIAPMTGALAKVAQLKPVTYKWNTDGSDGEGFIAHELAEVVPQCVTGAKDAVDADGKPVYQGIDTSFLVATLTAAIQELKAEFDAYKASHP